jgi:hypothetical protein
MVNEEGLMDIRALARQGYTYAETDRLEGRDCRAVKRYLQTGAHPVYRRRRMPSKPDLLKPLIDQWLARSRGFRRRGSIRTWGRCCIRHGVTLRLLRQASQVVEALTRACANRRGAEMIEV